ncbi:type IV pilus biogenesis/stability protein PilW [Halomonas cupida]|uniref:Type IV pilus assembly protein PilF n=1 Tax=Halomonas cupida TaxID=44933 RepID=A0A1M7IPL6_9GAMM|nr:type IV pilus biogenesis/stability protein PilW [Halomonas cupida]GEN24139.1 type IV pilus biogenesis/stability protein PilW [Halomonas cupida]SHM42609.1 type IV pilus assembly protein PilF [Halomonas cupida]
MTGQQSSTRAGIISLKATLLVLSGLLILPGLTGCASQHSGPASQASDPVSAYRQLGEAYLQQDNLPRAMSALDRALAIDAADPGALQAMAMVYQRQGEEDLAEHYFSKALALDPNFTRARNNYAAFLYDQGRTSAACEQLEIAARDTHYVNRSRLFANLGRCEWELGDVASARQDLQRAQEMDSRQPLSYLTLAELEYAQGNLLRARSQLDRYVHLAGPTPAARHLERKMTIAGDSSATMGTSDPQPRLATPGAL